MAELLAALMPVTRVKVHEYRRGLPALQWQASFYYIPDKKTTFCWGGRLRTDN